MSTEFKNQHGDTTMKYLTSGFAFLVAALLCLTCFTSAQAQEVDVVITPDEVNLAPGEGIQLEVFAFTINPNGRTPVAIDDIKWKIVSDAAADVVTDSLGTITQDGFFIAGRHVGVVRVVATITIGGRTIEKVVVIIIGRRAHPLFDVKVVPERAVVPFGEEQQFRVVVQTPLALHIRPSFIRWKVEPEGLGKISSEGLFQAGNDKGYGKVIAFVEIDGLTIRAAAKVVVSPPATGVLSGNVVTDADGAPLEGALVRAIRLGRIPWTGHARTDSLGDYAINELIPGVYVLTADARSYLGEFYDDTRSFLEATPINVSEGDTLTGFSFGLSEGGKITGTVIADSDSMPLAGAHVVAILRVNERIRKHALTDENGQYEIGPLATGTYVVRANATGYRREYYDDKGTFEQADFVGVVEPETTPDIDFSLAESSAIRGRVTKAADGTPIAGAVIRVFLTRRLAVDRGFFRETRTDENGDYILPVREGAYFVHASAEGFNSEFYDNARRFEDAIRVHVFADSHTVGIDFDLTTRGSIAGTVTDEVTGLPLEGAVVEAFKENNRIDAAVDGVGFRAKTDSLGNYLIENVPAGDYLVVSSAEEYLPEFYREAAKKDSATLVTVTDDASVTDINFTLLAGGSISGLVATEADSLPIPGALVMVYESETGFHRRGYSDESGAYTVRGLRTGRYYVRVVAEGFEPELYDNAAHRGEATLVDVTAPDDTPDIDFYLKKHVDRRGTIVGAVWSAKDQTPIMGAFIVAVSPRDRVPHFTFTGPFGFYRLTDLPAGKYFVFSGAEGFVGEFYDNAFRFKNADPVMVRHGQVTAGINFDLKPQPRRGIYTVRGRIRHRNSNAPLHGVVVQARLGDDVEVNTVTDVNGEYVISGLAAGEYVIEATAPGYADGYFGGSTPETASTVTVGNGEDASGVNMDLEQDNVTSIDDDGGSQVPESFDLSQNYPNPFNPQTSIKYQLAQSADVTLKIFNLLGQEVRTLVNKAQAAGVYTAVWDGKDDFGRQVSSGFYIYRLEAGEKLKVSKRMLLLK